MAFQILINIFIAIIWMFLQNNYTAVSFVVGYVVGILILLILRRFLTFDFYMTRVWAIIKLIILFIKQLILANIDMVKIVLAPKLKNKPGIIAVPTKLETEWEITLLACLISLTPGTISMDFSDDNKTIYIHAVDAQNKEDEIEQIQETFVRAIMEVTK
ncbi:Na+/H+ antiporter subunit E [Virgibacillus sp. NKC19-16]|uniref:Na+/H+ antiporter subunit E n=1 Tax=Virgibacillus salidurans TaxID=2831673 RepID=UPI001F3440FD|nr:Na+/H+ antiporter subunit E [Virgibacillus sp. NKC19-16]UJL44911.1 Na+/H+ antiporter subunit E [Virgibacillus sp. NKC19-16]